MNSIGSIGKSLRGIALSAVLATLAVASLAQELKSPVPPRFAIVDLGTLGGSFSLAYSINDKGQISGTSTVTGDTAQHSFLYSNGKMMDVGTLAHLSN